jgi:four helix bundle protein
MPKSHRDLVVWEKAVALAGAILRLTRTFPNHERWELTSQINRAAVSVAANIAEGAGKGTDRSLLQGLRIARGSLAELETEILVSISMGYVGMSSDYLQRITEIERLLNSLMAAIRRGEKFRAP